jgi:hypothetical protein
MMLKGHSGRISTGAGIAGAGISQSSNLRPGAWPSNEMQGTAGAASPRARSAAASASSRRGCASASIEAKLCGVTEGASGATATPARSAPRKTAA